MTRRRLWFIGRDEKSLCDNLKLASPKGEGFQPSLKGTLKPAALINYMTNMKELMTWGQD
jgi:hypothetical protein